MTVRKTFDCTQIDVLKEIGNIGVGHAVTALSVILNQPVDMSVPRVEVLAFEEVAEWIGGIELPVVAVFCKVNGEASGHMFYLLSIESANALLQTITKKQVHIYEGLNEIEGSAIAEIGNILTGSYLSSLGDFLNIKLYPSVPGLAMDMAGPILSHAFLEDQNMGDQALLIQSSFSNVSSPNRLIDGTFLFIPDFPFYDVIFKTLGVNDP